MHPPWPKSQKAENRGHVSSLLFLLFDPKKEIPFFSSDKRTGPEKREGDKTGWKPIPRVDQLIPE
jgi:hypothetical protein